MQDMGNDAGRYDPALAVSDARPQGPRTCGHDKIGGVDGTQAATELDQYATRHNPFMYFRSIIDERSEEHTSELQSLMRISYAVFCLKKKKNPHSKNKTQRTQ